MTAQPTTAWGQTLKTASLMRQEKRGSLSEPIPTFFHEKSGPENGGQAHILRSHEADERVHALTQMKQRALSPEFMRAITLTESDESVPAPLRHEEKYLNDSRGLNVPVEDQQGVVFKMNKFSLVALIVGLLLLGLMFFAGGLMLAFNFSSHEAAAPQQAQQTQQSHDHSGALTAGRALVTLLPSGAQNTVSQANQVGSVAQTVSTAVPASAAHAPAPVAGVAPAGASAQPAAPLGAMPGARGVAAPPAAHAAPVPGAVPVAPVVVVPMTHPATVPKAPPAAAMPLAQPVVALAPQPAALAPQPAVALAPQQPVAVPQTAPVAVAAPTPVAPSQPVAPPAALQPAPAMPSQPVAPPAALQPVPIVPQSAAPNAAAPNYPAPAAPAPAAPALTAPIPQPAPAGQPVAVVQGPVLDATALTRPFSLQVGAYGNLEGAQKVVTLLHRRGYNAYVVAMPLATQGKDFAVRMGGYYTRQAAMTAAEHLMRKEHFKIMAITKNNAERVIL
jgi:cell division septation protein DedD